MTLPPAWLNTALEKQRVKRQPRGLVRRIARNISEYDELIQIPITPGCGARSKVFTSFLEPCQYIGLFLPISFDLFELFANFGQLPLIKGILETSAFFIFFLKFFELLLFFLQRCI